MIARLSVLMAVFVSLMIQSAGAQTPNPGSGITMSPYLAGDAFDRIPETPDGSLSVAMFVVTDGAQGQAVAVVRNRTDETALGVTLVVTARTADGALYAVSDGGYVHPRTLEPGAVGITQIRFGDARIPGDLIYEFLLTPDPYGDRLIETFPNLEIVSADRIENRIVGEAFNGTESAVAIGLIQGACFYKDTITGAFTSMLPVSQVQPGQTVPFQVDLRIGACDAFLLAIG